MNLNVSAEAPSRAAPSLAWSVAWCASAVFHAAGVLALGLIWISATSGPPMQVILAHLDDASYDSPLDELRLTAAAAAVKSERPPLARNLSSLAEVLIVTSAEQAFAFDVPGGSQGALGALEESVANLDMGEQMSVKALGKSVSFYGIEAGGAEFVFVVDMSGSMEGARFRRARNELRKSIESLEPFQSYYVIFFSDGAYPMPGRVLVPRTDRNVRDTVRWLKAVQPQGPTNPLPALLQAIDMAPDAIFLLSDGKFEMETAFEVARYKTGDAIPIHTISFASREGEPMLKAIAKATGGTYRYVK
jgi:hypothetical protein